MHATSYSAHSCPAAPANSRNTSTVQLLDLTANRLKNFEAKVLALQHLTSLCVRQNLLSEASEVEALASAAELRHLELRDNQFTAVPSLEAFTSLTYLELSYNDIRHMAPLASLRAPHLEELYVANNKVTAIESVSQLTSLQVLELGSNRIRVIEGLDTLQNLRELWLGRNRITEISNMGALCALRRLALQSNRLTSMRGLSECTALEELYLSHNGIKSIEVSRRWRKTAAFVTCPCLLFPSEAGCNAHIKCDLPCLQGLENLTKLQILDISNNQIESLEGLQTLTNLTDLWANDNLVPDLDAVEAALKPISKHLSVVYLRGNPCATHKQYKLRVMHLLPKLEELDGVPLNRK